MRNTYLVIAGITLALGCGDGDGGPANDGGTRKDAALDASMRGCPEVIGCVDACTTDPCVAACVASATPEATTQLTALVDCTAREACGEDDACIEANCAAEVAACQGIVLDGGVIVHNDGAVSDASTEMPSRIVGTSRDYGVLGGILTLDSNATLEFVRDDAAGDAAGVPSSMFAFYRLKHVEYRATAVGSNGICEVSADSTETFTDPPAFENHLAIAREAGMDGLHLYYVSTSLSVNHPTGMTVVCPPPIPSNPGIFNAEHNLTTGTSSPRSDGMTFVGSTSISERQFMWDLHVED